jgi:hypothetical protein
VFHHHVEVLFGLPGNEDMSWARIVEIDIDHCVPIGYPGAAGGPPTIEEKVTRLHYLNCQPLWRHNNRTKGHRRADPVPAYPAVPQIENLLTDAELEELMEVYGIAI